MTIQNDQSLIVNIHILEPLCHELKLATDVAEKLQIVSSNSEVSLFFKNFPKLLELMCQQNLEAQYVMQSVVAIGQGAVVFKDIETLENLDKELNVLLEHLLEIEKFYQDCGGIVGYHLLVLKMLVGNNSKSSGSEESLFSYGEPEGWDCSSDTLEVRQAVRWGLEHMNELAEIYPIGGAGDRLNLQDEESGELLPAAQLLFCGRTLIDGLVRDLQGREFLYYKLFGQQITTPIAAMTSEEKNNHKRVMSICEDAQWFGRPRQSFSFFKQPLVPVITTDGEWAMQGPLYPFLKPGGHGVIWKAADEQGVFEWFGKKKCSKAIVRQINNPIAGLDNGLLGLSGIGCHYNKGMGFSSCDRLLATAEGMDVLRERKVDEGYEYSITNVEYTEFERCNIHDIPVEPGSAYSRFPANTNILFVNIRTIKEAMKLCPIPGMLINMKTLFKCYVGTNQTIEKYAGRLESTMQNIADWIVDIFPKPLKRSEHRKLGTYITFNERIKTISVAKQSYEAGKSLVGTPEGCFYDLMENYYDLLGNYCGMQLPQKYAQDDYLANGPNFTALFHPALGGVYSVIAQKIQGGRILAGSEWVMEIAEAQIINLDLEGSLIIEAKALMGEIDEEGVVIYDSETSGKCTLIDVKVKNEGLMPTNAHRAWKRDIERKASLRVTLHGNAEFFAENVIFEGDLSFDVPKGFCCNVIQEGSQISWRYEQIENASWRWNYSFDAENRICLKRKSGAFEADKKL